MIKVLTLAASLAFLSSPVLAEPTHVMVRAQAQDAKFIGDHMGGVLITLTDARTGAVLAKGLTKGGTGDTPRIMKTPRTRGMGLTDPSAAGFEAVLDLKQPTLVHADALGPMGKLDSQIKVSSSLWVIPGRDIVGDGWILEFPGLVVEPTASVPSDGRLHLTAHISLMCGCPIETGGLWNAANYAVTATVSTRGKVIAEAPLSFTGNTGEFTTTIPEPPPGAYAVKFVATDSKTLNAGVAERKIRVSR